MNFIAPRTEPLIRDIPLSRLSLAPENVRKTPPDAQADASLKASIAALGLLENLVVRPDDPSEDGAERYAVVAGGRRLKAMQALVEDGVFDADHPVSCQVRSGDAEPAELSLAENVIRIAMHPADQVVAFSDLVRAGQPVAAIAARFGASERIVEQRLRLGNAAPELLEAYRAGEIDLEVLKAFAVTADRERQKAAWERVSAQGYRPSAWQVKRLLTEERVPGTASMARFVGVEAYEASGGAVMRDLFAPDDDSGVFFEDPALLETLAMAKLRSAADELATRWRWARPVIEAQWSDTARYGQIAPQPGTPTEEERAEIETLETRHDELVNLDEEDWTDELVAEGESVVTRLEEIRGAIEARATFRREDFARAGCLVTIGEDGALLVVQGLVRPEDMPKPDEAQTAAPTAGGGPAAHPRDAAGTPVSAPMAPPRDPAAEARKQAGVGIGLADDLRHVRTALVKAELSGDFEAAFDLMLFQMGRSLFARGYCDHALDIAVRETPDRPTIRANDHDFADRSPGEAMLADLSGLALDWLEIEDDGASFAALSALPQAEKQGLFAACVARTVKPQLAFEAEARPEIEATVARLDIDFARHVRPTAALLWSRLPKARLLDIARVVLGAAWASMRAKSRKPALAEAMEAAFAAGETPMGLSAPMHAAALAWTPPGFRAFDSGRVVEAAAEASTGADAGNGGEASTGAPAEDTGDAPEAGTVDPPRRTSVVESIESPDEKARRALAARKHGEESGAAGGESAPDSQTEERAAAPASADGSETGDPAGSAAGEAEDSEAEAGVGALPEDLAAAIDAVNRVPTADGKPRVVFAHVGPEPGRANGHAPDATEIPEFLRSVH